VGVQSRRVVLDSKKGVGLGEVYSGVCLPLEKIGPGESAGC